MDDQPGVQFGLQAIMQRLLALEQFGQRLEMLPQVGPRGDLEGAFGVAADAAPQAGFILRQQQIVEAYRVSQIADEQPAIVRIHHLQMQDELLLVQPRLDRFDPQQMHLWLAPVTAAPTGTARQ